MSTRTINIDDRLYQYLLRYSLRESAIQRELREATLNHERGGMQVAPEQGQFMALMVELLGAKMVIEVGTFTGYSALCMAQAMPSGGRLVCCDISEEWTSLAFPYWRRAGVYDRIDLRIAPAQQTLDALIDSPDKGRFDMVFIDADKENYRNYYERALKLVRGGGLIMLDNMLWGGAVADESKQDPESMALREMNRFLHGDDRVSLSLLPIGDGLTLTRKR